MLHVLMFICFLFTVYACFAFCVLICFYLCSVHRDRSVFIPSSPTHTWFTSGVYKEGVVTWDEEGLVTMREEHNTYWHERPKPEDQHSRIAYVFRGEFTLQTFRLDSFFT